MVVFPTLGRRLVNYPHGEMHQAVAEAAQASGLAVLDLRDCYAGYDFRELRVDVVHPSPLGHRVAAHAIRDELCARGWLCAGGIPSGPGCRDYRAADFPRVAGTDAAAARRRCRSCRAAAPAETARELQAWSDQ